MSFICPTSCVAEVLIEEFRFVKRSFGSVDQEDASIILDSEHGIGVGPFTRLDAGYM